MKYIRAATMNNPNLSSEEKNKAFHDTQLINEKTKQKGFKSSSTLSRRAKATTGITIEKHILEAELIKRKKRAHLEKKNTPPFRNYLSRSTAYTTVSNASIGSIRTRKSISSSSQKTSWWSKTLCASSSSSNAHLLPPPLSIPSSRGPFVSV